MNRKRDNHNLGVSDVIGSFLIILLVVGLVAVVAAFLMPGLFPKSVYIASEVGPVEVTQSGSGIPTQVLYLLPKAGEPFYFSGQQKPAGGARVSMRAIAPDGRNMTPATNEIVGNPYGQTLYIYPNNTPGSGPCDCVVSPNLPKGAYRLMTNGVWTIQLIDEDAHMLVMSNSDGKITDGTTALPRLGGTVGGWMYRADCTILDNSTPNGNLPINYNNTMHMYYRTFNGSTYMQYPNDPTLSYTGDMAISLWMDPSDTGSWHQIIGKGVTYNAGSSSSNELDNYQVFQVGNQLLFEWNDAGNGQHYQAMTPAVVQANQWSYLTVTVQNGQLAMYYNGVSLPLTYDNSNVPGQNLLPGPVPVNLINNNNPVTIGKQNSPDPGNSFYYTGAIGNTAIYNRGLTPQEIQDNYHNYAA
ncbi:MAG TPA: LamG domain-containing protein [Methanoregulaceae archaeon]|nr:LamG domain-containing protein [Methanoregulaceae archaeon]